MRFVSWSFIAPLLALSFGCSDGSEDAAGAPQGMAGPDNAMTGGGDGTTPPADDMTNGSGGSDPGMSAGGNTSTGGSPTTGGSSNPNPQPQTCTQYATAGHCDDDTAEICIDGEWEPANCNACGLIVGCFDCCESVNIFAITDDGTYNELAGGVTEVDMSEPLRLITTFEFSAAGNMGIIQIPHGRLVQPDSMRVTIFEDEANTATVDYEATMDNGSGTAGCKYEIVNPTNSYWGDFLPKGDYPCWGGYFPMEGSNGQNNPTATLNIRFVAKAAGTYRVQISGIEFGFPQ